jgi:prophage regulatory protein
LHHVVARVADEKEVRMQFIRIRQVLEMIGVSRTTLWRMVQAGTFPRPVRITERNRGYKLETVEEWMTARTDGTPVDMEIPGVVRKRAERRAAARAALARLPRTG